MSQKGKEVRAETSGGMLHGEGAYARLLEAIRSGELAPGTRLTETDIAQWLNISRTPVREAIRRLEADGLVNHLPRAGALVRQLSCSEIMELYEVRVVLEGTAARLAARSASELEIEELAAVNTEMEQAEGDGARLFEQNRQFHAALIDAARNRYLMKSLNAVQTTLLILGPSTLAESGRAREAVVEHQAVIEALRRRDGAAAETLMRQHMESALRTRLRLLRSGSNLSEQDEEEGQ